MRDDQYGGESPQGDRQQQHQLPVEGGGGGLLGGLLVTAGAGGRGPRGPGAGGRGPGAGGRELLLQLGNQEGQVRSLAFPLKGRSVRISRQYSSYLCNLTLSFSF